MATQICEKENQKLDKEQKRSLYPLPCRSQASLWAHRCITAQTATLKVVKELGCLLTLLSCGHLSYPFCSRSR
jgi:hypothetical protein